MEEKKSTSPDRIGVKIKCLSNLLKRRMASDAVVEHIDEVTGMHGWLIGYIERQGDVYQRDVEKRFNMRRSTVTKMLQLMEKNGLVTRESVESDARLKKIVLTDKALQASKIMRKKIDESEELMKRGIDEEELKIFCRVADKIAENLKGECSKEEEC